MSAWLEARVATLESLVTTLMRQVNSLGTLASTTTAVNDSGNVQTVQAQLDALSWRDNIPLLYNYGFTGSPPVGADLHVTYIDGVKAKAVAIASAHQTYRLRGLGVGDSALYDSRGVSVWLTPAGPVINCAGLPMSIVSAGTITMQTPRLAVTGDIIDNTASNPLTLAQTRADYNAHVHQVPNVAGGTGTATTAAPVISET